MIFEPIFRRESRSASRSMGTYALRAIWGILIGTVVWALEYGWDTATEGGVLASHWLSLMGLSFLASIFLAQSLLVFFGSPARFADAVALETERRTLHDILTTRLTSAEIVLQKAAARFAEIIGILLIGLPFSLPLADFSGAEPRLVPLFYLAVLSTSFFTGSSAIFFSCLLHRSRPAKIAASAWIGFWFFGTAILENASFWILGRLPTRFVLPAKFLFEANDWIYASSPLSLLRNLPLSLFLINLRAATLMDDYIWMLVLQAVYGFCFLLASIAVLRPRYRRILGANPRRERARSIRSRGPTGDPLFWKERRVSRGRGIGLILDRAFKLASLAIVVGILWAPCIEALEESVSPSKSYQARQDLNIDLRYATFWLIALLILKIAQDASSRIGREREQETWTSLLATGFDGWEILRGKAAAAVWSQRFWAFTLIALWAIGLVSGAIHWLGFVAGVVGLIIFAVWTSIMGVGLSLASRSSKTANSFAALLLIAVNAWGPLIDSYLPQALKSDAWWAFCAPMNESMSLISYRDYYQIMKTLRTKDFFKNDLLRQVFASGLVFFGYALTAAIIWIAAVKAFDRAAGRPYRSRTDQRPSERPKELAAIAECG